MPTSFKILRTLFEPHIKGGRIGGQNLGTYLMESEENGLLCVKKLLSRSNSAQETGADREIKALRKLGNHRHPNVNTFIVALNSSREGTPVTELIVKYCDMGDLHHVIEKFETVGRSLPEPFIWHVFMCMAKALVLCHTGANDYVGRRPQDDFEYIIHGDIKPNNIFFTSRPGALYPEAVLGDFGGAKTKAQIERCRQHKERFGMTYTPGFDAPEHHTNPNPKVDIFSLAVTVMIMMGAQSLRGGSRLEEKTEKDQLEILYDTGYSTALKDTVRQAACLEEKGRPNSIELARAIEKAWKGAIETGRVPDAANARALREELFTKHSERQPAWAAGGVPQSRGTQNGTPSASIGDRPTRSANTKSGTTSSGDREKQRSQKNHLTPSISNPEDHETLDKLFNEHFSPLASVMTA